MLQKKEDLPIKAYLGSDALFKGSLTFEGTVQIDGKFEVGTLVCKGKLRGTVLASKKIEMHPASKITGNIQTPALSVELGAVLDGNLNMTGRTSEKIINLVKEAK